MASLPFNTFNMESLKLLTCNLDGKKKVTTRTYPNGIAETRRSMVRKAFESSDIIFTQEQGMKFELEDFEIKKTDESYRLKNQVYVRRSLLAGPKLDCEKLSDPKLLVEINEHSFPKLEAGRLCAVWVTLGEEKVPALLVSYHGKYNNCKEEDRVKLAELLFKYANGLANKEEKSKTCKKTRKPIIIIGGDWNLKRELIVEWINEGSEDQWYCEDYTMSKERIDNKKLKVDYFVSNVPFVPGSTAVELHDPEPDYDCLDHDMVTCMFDFTQQVGNLPVEQKTDTLERKPKRDRASPLDGQGNATPGLDATASSLPQGTGNTEHEWDVTEQMKAMSMDDQPENARHEQTLRAQQEKAKEQKK